MAQFLAVTPVALPSGETADFSWRFSATNAIAALSAYNAWAAYLNTAAGWKSQWFSNTQFLQGKISEYDLATGKILSTQVGGVAYYGTGLTASLPPQIAICVTLRSAFAGKSNTGRFYLPAPATTQTDATGRLLTADCTAIVTALKGAFNAAVAAGADTIDIYSTVHRNVRFVVSIDCGNVLDTIRTRRDKLIEARQSATL